jgi:hypothetical protein
MMATADKEYGLLAEFDTPAAIYQAAEKCRDAGYTKWDALTPFPIHGMDAAMGLKRSPLAWVVLVMGLTGSSLAMLLQWWVHTTAYPLVISGKPYFSWQAFIPVTFELGVLFAALGAVISILHFSKLPRWHHPLFSSKRFERVTQDRFFIAIEAEDPKYNRQQTEAWLQSLGATFVEQVEDKDAE